jgi:hypothetical protein
MEKPAALPHRPERCVAGVILENASSGLVEPQRCQLQSDKKAYRTFANQLLTKVNALSPFGAVA